MKHTHHLPSPEFLFLPIHLSFSTGKWPHPFCHFLTPFKQLPFCFLILQHRSSHETLSVLSVWHEILQFYHFLHADWPGKSKQELCSIFISKANLQEDLYGVFSVSDAVCLGHRTSLEEGTRASEHKGEAPVCFTQVSTSVSLGWGGLTTSQSPRKPLTDSFPQMVLSCSLVD